MREQTKEQAYEEIQQQLTLCTVEKSIHSAVVIIVNNESETIKVYGLNMDEMELPMLLLETAAEVSERIKNIIKNRTIQ